MLEYFPRIFIPVFVRFSELLSYVNPVFPQMVPYDLTLISNLAMLYIEKVDPICPEKEGAV